MNFRTISVVGFGRMGQSLTLWLAVQGMSVVVLTRRQPEVCMKVFEASVLRLVSQKKVDEGISAPDVISRVSFVDVIEYENVEWVLECLEEDLSVKRHFLSMLPRDFKGIVSTNTSTLRINDLIRYAPSANLFMGTHFFNPVPIISLVEVVAGESTDQVVVRRVCDFLETHGKVPIRAPDQVGFLVNRILFSAMFEAMAILDRNQVSVDEVNTCIKLGCSWPMGPLELADYIGLDVCERIMENLAEDNSYSFSRVPGILRKLVSEGHLGRKTGKGFYKYG